MNIGDKKAVICLFWCIYCGCMYIKSININLKITMFIFLIEWAIFLALMITYFKESDIIKKEGLKE